MNAAPFNSLTVDMDQVVSQGRSLSSEFQKRIQDAPYQEKGVLFSELLFISAVIGLEYSGLFLESVRARGQSTLGLGLLLPKARIVSVEFLRDPVDAPIAEERLKDLANVRLEYGDSRRLLPGWVEPGAVALIDGPKSFSAVRLALTLLKTGQVRCVFIHDTNQGKPSRRFLQGNAPGVFFSDDEKFVEAFRHLDEPCWQASESGASSWRPFNFHGQRQESYGPTLACLPYRQDAGYGMLQWRLRLVQWKTKCLRSAQNRGFPNRPRAPLFTA